MARLFVFIVVFSGLIVGMCATKPTEADYLRKLEDRAAIVASSDHDAFAQLRGGDPVDEMVAGQSSRELIEQTHVEDYVVFSVFTTQYYRPGYSTQQIRTYGLFSILISIRDD